MYISEFSYYILSMINDNFFNREINRLLNTASVCGLLDFYFFECFKDTTHITSIIGRNIYVGRA